MTQNQINLIKREDWLVHQICGDFPNVDVRCLTFCCSPAKPCPLRNAVLDKMGLSVKDYTRIKAEFADKMFFDRKNQPSSTSPLSPPPQGGGLLPKKREGM